MNFSLIIRRKTTWDYGVVVIGRIQSGIVYNNDNVIIHVEGQNFTAHVEYISRRYSKYTNVYEQNGVDCCSKGNNVALYLSGIGYNVIKPNRSFVKKDTTVKEHNNQPKEQNCTENINGSIKTNDNYDTKLIDISLKLKSIEKNFVQDILMCIKRDRCITPTVLYVLDKLRDSYCISEERGRELILSTIKNFEQYKNETIYRDAVAACLLDCGYLTETESILLEKLRKTLGIPENVAYMIKKGIEW